MGDDDKYTLPPCYGTEGTITALLDPSIRREFIALDQGGQGITVEYVWIGGTGQDMRSKTRTLTKDVKGAGDLPDWNYDGSSCGQAPGEDSEVYLVPRQIYKDPFRYNRATLNRPSRRWDQYLGMSWSRVFEI